MVSSLQDARARSFGEDAEGYDRARPSYPEALIDELAGGHPGRVLDVGCGTAKAGRLFVARGCQVTGVEHDARMAVVARRYGLDVIVSPFESWDPNGATYDLVISGQAWHWIDQTTGPAKVAGVLAPDGRVGLFWNHGTHDPDVQATFDEIYDRVLPSTRPNHPAGTQGHDRRREADERFLPALGRVFGRVESSTFAWEATYTTDQWLDVLPTHSGHRLLPAEVRQRLLDALGEAIDGWGGRLFVHYQTLLLSAWHS